MIGWVCSGCNTYNDALQEAPVLSADIAVGKTLYETQGCVGCHGADASNAALGVSRNIAQIGSARDVENALYALQAPTSQRQEAMKSAAAELSSQDIVNVALYIATLP